MEFTLTLTNFLFIYFIPCSVTRSPFSDLIPEYVKAQEIGEGRTAPGECFPYHKECPRSLFKALQNHKYKYVKLFN